MEKQFHVNTKEASIHCKLYSDGARTMSRVILYIHGFGGHMDNRAAARFAELVLSKYKDIGILTFNLPCHGDDVRRVLSLEDCDRYISAVTDYVSTELGAKELFVYATSFGGYLFLRHIHLHGNRFLRSALRCPAVNMHEAMLKNIMTEENRQQLRKGRAASVGFDRKVQIDQAFLTSLAENDLMQFDFTHYSESVIIIQGTKDEIVDIDAVFRFADQNEMMLFTVEGADHRFMDPRKMDEAIKTILDFFELGT